jgi:hypothetical protein
LLWPILRLTYIVDGVVVVAGKVVVGMAMVGEVVDGAVVVEVGVEERAVDGEGYGAVKTTYGQVSTILEVSRNCSERTCIALQIYFRCICGF